MTNALATNNSTDLDMQALENVLVNGDLSRLSAQDRLSYYRNVCASVGLNPLTKPFDYLKLSGRLVLYARKDATDQLRRIHNVSIEITGRERMDDVYVVTALARLPDGRTDSEIGAVTVAGLKGEALANAMMKATTKAKRRVTLSICGMGMLDETETETIPAQQRQFVEVNHNTGEIVDAEPDRTRQTAPTGRLSDRYILRLEELATAARIEYEAMNSDAQERYGRPSYAQLTVDEAKDYAEWLKALASDQAEADQQTIDV